MSGSAPSNTDAVDFEKQQAAQADAKEALRQQRLEQGKTLIDQIFNGQPVMANQTNAYDWSKFNPTATRATGANAFGTTISDPSLPSGYKVISVPGQASTAPGAAVTAGSQRAPDYGQYTGGALAGPNDITSQTGGHGAVSVVGRGSPTAAAGAPGAGGGFAIQGPDGKIYRKGDPLNYTTSVDTGQRTGGFGDDYYNAYKQKYLDYYLPDETRQYAQAKQSLLYNLANAGLSTSSTTGEKFGDLGYQDTLAQAGIKSKAEDVTGQLKQQIQSEKESALNQLYSTEDPTLAANLAQSSAKASQLQTPTLTPMVSLFTPALVGATSFASNYASPYNPYPLTPGGTTAPVAPASSGSGKPLIS
ncbi:MAG TPA: hypothetical protein VGF39_05845 [Stellaceae bacterium]|jgi:hypothetical protein